VHILPRAWVMNNEVLQTFVGDMGGCGGWLLAGESLLSNCCLLGGEIAFKNIETPHHHLP